MKLPIRPRLLMSASALILSSFAVPSAHAGLFSNLFIFGDSVSDSGNVALATLQPFGVAQDVTGNSYIPSAPYPASPPVFGNFGVFSNGPVWATYFASMIGVTALPSVLPGADVGTNYAFGGARSGGASASSPSLLTQTAMFLGDYDGVAPSDALYVVAPVGNDARTAVEGIGAAIAGGADPAVATLLGAGAAAFNYANNVGSIVDQLQGAGAKNILVFNTVNLGLTPAATSAPPGTVGISTTVSLVMNGALSERLTGETGVQIFDAFSFLSGVAANPGAYGLDNVTDACGAIALADCGKYLFWDGIHPTTAMQSKIAGAVFAQVVPEPQTYALMGLGLFAVVWAARRRKASA